MIRINSEYGTHNRVLDCEAEAQRGTGTGACGRPLDQHGQCDRPSNHL